jgi:plasmid stability protein
LGQPNVRNLDDDVILALKRRAARHGRSSDADNRAILREVLAAERVRPSFNALLASMPDVGEDEDFGVRRDLPRGAEWRVGFSTAMSPPSFGRGRARTRR